MPDLFNVVTPDEALRLFHAHVPYGTRREVTPTAQALGRFTAREVLAPGSLPSFPRSTMDGYAVRAADTYGASEGLPVYLKIVGEVPMGRAAGIGIGRGEVAKIHTGGMLAQGADAVVMVENTQEVDASTIEVLRPVAPGENVIQVGEDVREGQTLLPAGHRLRPQDLGGLLALGITKVEVAPRPRVAIISSGDEVVPPEAEPAPGQVRDINSYTLAALAKEAGAEALTCGIVRDDYAALLEAAQRAVEAADMLVISAGSSVSTRDMTAQVIASLGQPGILVHGVAVRPGKPTILAVANGKPIVGLPGNPVSAMVIFDLFVTPAIYRLAGCQKPPLRTHVRARLTRNVASATGREDYVRVRIEERNGELWAHPIFGESNLISTMMRADGLAKIPLDLNGLEEGEMVTVRLF